MGANERLDLAELSLSAGEFTELRMHVNDGVPIVAMVAPAQDARGWYRASDLWMDLPLHPNLLEALDRTLEGQLLVRYAAIDWKHRSIRVDEPWTVKMVATWGLQLTDVMSLVAANVPAEEAASLTHIKAHIDLDGHLRVGFAPAQPDHPMALKYWPDDVIRGWPACDERGLVFVVANALSGLFTRDHIKASQPLDAIVQRCQAPRPRDRFQTLSDLRKAFVDAGAHTLRIRDEECSRHTELGIGLLALGEYTRAQKEFEIALKLDPWAWLAIAGRNRTKAWRPDSSARQREYRPLLSWATVESAGAKLESERAFAEALDLYRRTHLDGQNDCAILMATARTHLQLGESGHAIDYAQRVLALDPQRTDALAVLVSGFLLHKKFDEALRFSDLWLALGVDQAGAHYRRGKALLALKRLGEARDAFDRALAADPRLVPAMLLRREADRMFRDIRSATGVQRPIEIDVPAHLPELKPIFAAGKIAEAITMLAGDVYADDSRAQLVRASCLEFVLRFAEAADIYERVASRDPEHRHAALLGRAGTLMELGDPEASLELFDALRVDRPDDLDVIEGRAWVLDRLGRTADAQAEFRRYVALNQGASNRRLGARRR